MFGVVQSILYVVVTQQFFSAFVEKKENKRWVEWTTWIVLFFYRMIVMVSTQNSLQNFLGNLIGILLVLYVLYVHRWQTFVLAPIWFFSIMGVIETALGLGIIWICGSIDPTIRLYGAVSNIIFWFVTKILQMTIKKPLEDNGTKRESLILAGIALVNIIPVILFFEMNNRINSSVVHGTTFILMAALLVVDILGFKIYGFLYDRKMMNFEKAQYAYQLELCNKEMDERKITMDEIRRVRHDMKNHMIYLQKLVENDPEKAQAYIGDFLSNSVTKEVSQTGNLVIDALINYKYLLATQKDIEMLVDVHIPEKLDYEAADLCIILGNLLDNAIEAAEKCDQEKKIKLKMAYVKRNFIIEIENTFCGDVNKGVNGMYKTNKADTKKHGIGLQSVQRSIEKYKGTLETEITEESHFIARVMI